MKPISESKIELSVVVPMYNEESNIDLFFERLLALINQLTQQYEIICVNDGST